MSNTGKNNTNSSKVFSEQANVAPVFHNLSDRFFDTEFVDIALAPTSKTQFVCAGSAAGKPKKMQYTRSDPKPKLNLTVDFLSEEDRGDVAGFNVLVP